MRDGLKRESDVRLFFSFFPRTNSVARFDIILTENCFSQFYETRKLRSLLREGWNISGGGGEGKKNRSGEIGKMEFPVRISPNGISPLDSTNGGNEGEKLAGIFDHDDPPEFHFSENVVRTFAPRAY